MSIFGTWRGSISQVQRLISEGVRAEAGLYEILDDEGHELVVKAHREPRTWLEVPVE